MRFALEELEKTGENARRKVEGYAGTVAGRDRCQALIDDPGAVTLEEVATPR